MMYADVVMEKAEGMEPADGKGIRKIMDYTLDAFKKAHGDRSDILPVPLRQTFGRQSDDRNGRRALPCHGSSGANAAAIIRSGSGEKLTVRLGR
jgi:hypothetical protein